MSVTDNDNCWRCGEPVRLVDMTTNGTPVYDDAAGRYCCEDFHGHDDNGVYSPMHTLVDDNDSTVVPDSSDGCYFDEALDEWVVVHSDL